MASYPAWAHRALAAEQPQVSHGLNLVLELQPIPNLLPLMLWDIVVAQDKIKRALTELNFIHFARFIPTWDGRALMVTTEFDGPFEPYVLDFVIALGDVFDTLLAYVVEPPPLPVREYPDEFLAWVRHWNRAPFYLRDLYGDAVLIPEFVDYPVFSAYPELTVTDIAGPRKKLPPPALDHPAAPVDLADVQGNILRGYNATAATYLFFRITQAEQARQWLTTTLLDKNKAWRGIACASYWTADTRPEVFTQVAFSFAGLQMLLPRQRHDDLAYFPRAFVEGADERAADNGDKDDSDPGLWRFGQDADPVHVVLSLYTKELGGATTLADPAYELKTCAEQSGLALMHRQDAETGLIAFGFQDGVSMINISGQCPVDPDSMQPSASPGEFLLHKDYASLYGGSSLGRMPQRLAGNGSFGVLRLMEQDVEQFERMLAGQSRDLNVDPDQLKQAMMGRTATGEPIAQTRCPFAQHTKTNAFDYAPSWEYPGIADDHQGQRCPVGSHIRRSNPRSARVAGQSHARRLIRRGMSAEWPDSEGKRKVGLMGLFFCASIEQQFEFIQRHWIQGSEGASGIRGTTDPIAGIRSGTTEFRFFAAPLSPPNAPNAPKEWMTAHIPPLIQTRGCVYLFYPGLQALRTLGETKNPSNEKDRPARVSRLVGEALLATVNTVIQTVGGTIIGIAGALSSGFRRFLTGIYDALLPVVRRLWPRPEMPLAPFHNEKLLARIAEHPEITGLADGRWGTVVKQGVLRGANRWCIRKLVQMLAPPHKQIRPDPRVRDAREIDPNDPRFVADPYAVLKTLRDAGHRIVWVEAQKAYWVLDHAGCQDLLMRKSDFVQVKRGTKVRGIVTQDEPRHVVVRKAVAEAFASALEAVRPSIAGIVDDQIRALERPPGLMQFDYMGSFAFPVSRRIFWQLFGIRNPAKSAACDVLAHKMAMNYGRADIAGKLAFGDAATRLLFRVLPHLFRAWIGSHSPRSCYRRTLLGELSQRMWPGLPLPHRRPLNAIEVLISLLQIIAAGQSPHYLLGSAALHLLKPVRQPDGTTSTNWADLASLDGAQFDETLACALEEARRCEPPLTVLQRFADGSQTICDVKVPDGCQVFAAVFSANRDAKVFKPDPDDFVYDRPMLPAGQLSLGHGIHHCVGQAVQAAMVGETLGQMIRAMPDLQLSHPDAVAAWHDTINFRVLQSLPVQRPLPPGAMP